MTRRILVMLMAFTALILVGAMVPLALNTTSHDRNSFIQAATSTVRTDAAVVQSALLLAAQQSNGANSGGTLAQAQASIGKLQVVKEARQAGDGLLILSHDLKKPDQQVAESGMPSGNWDALAQQANNQAQAVLGTDQAIQPATTFTGSQLLVAMPVYSSGTQGQWVGTVLLARSTTPLDREIATLWTILGAIAVGGHDRRGAARLRAGPVGEQAAEGPGLPRPAGWPTATWPSGPRSTPAPRSCAAWAPPSTPWPDGSRPWCTGTGP